MPLVDMRCHFGVVPSSMAVRPPELTEASSYANQYGVEHLCFISHAATADLEGGNSALALALAQDERFRGWLGLSIHQPDHSQELARRYLTRGAWIGAYFDQPTDADALSDAGGHEVLNALRRYGKPVLCTIHTPVTLHATLAAARVFTTLRFLVTPGSEEIAADILPAMKEVLNVSLVPVAASAERDMIAQAVQIIGERRILWASDWGRCHPAAALGMLRDSALTNHQRERLALRNGREIIAGST